MKKFGLIGKSLNHSYSKTFFTDFFTKNNINATFDNFEITNEKDLQQLLKLPFNGLSVTIPYKETVMKYLDELSVEVEKIGAVNCIQFVNGKTIGHNTDVFGFHQSIKPFLTNKHERAIILGTGGASKAVEYVLKKIGIDCIFLSRNPQKDNHFSYNEANNHMINACKLIINCTPIGMYPQVDDYIRLPFEHLTTDHLVVDLIYNPFKTKLLEKSELAGAQILNGETMLQQQALEAWKIWNS